MFNTTLPYAPNFTPSPLFVTLLAASVMLIGLLGMAWVICRGEYTLQHSFKKTQAVSRLVLTCLATMVWVRMFATLLQVPTWLLTTDMPFIQAGLITLGAYIFGSGLGIFLLTCSSLLHFWPRTYIWMPACVAGALAWAYTLLVSLA